MAPLVSVIIPTYNRSEHLLRAINSVLSQTFSDFELIIIDDASTDDTSQTVERFSDNRIRYYKKGVNEGGGAARNAGISYASGKYVAFLDSDDEWMLNKLELQIGHMEKHNAFVSYTGFILWDDMRKMEIGEQRPTCQGNISEEILKRNCVGTTSTVVVRQECFTNTGGFDVRMPQSQDWEMWIRLAESYHFHPIDSILCRYHVHSGLQITGNPAKAAIGMELLLNKHIDKISVNRKVYAQHLARIGLLKALSSGVREGRNEQCHAIVQYPFLIEAYINLLRMAFGQKCFDALYRAFSKKLKPTV